MPTINNRRNVLFMFSSSGQTDVKPQADPDSGEEALQLHLSQLDDWFLEVKCCQSLAPGLQWFTRRYGDLRLCELISRLKCSRCGGPPKYLHIQDAPYYKPGLSGKKRFILIGDENTEWCPIERRKSGKA